MKYNIITNIEIESVNDLYKLGTMMKANNIKPNYSALARELGIDRRVVKKYMENEIPKEKKITRNRGSQFDQYEPIITKLLLDMNKLFTSKRSLYEYMVDNFNMSGSESSFRHYLSKNKNINELLANINRKNYTNNQPSLLFETQPGEQAQLDWKENIELVLKDGRKMKFNVLVLILGYSRFRVALPSLSKDRKTLMHLLTEMFKILGGVPETILFDNMKTVMDLPRTGNSPGVINNEFQHFADDMGFKIKICVARRPKTKGKVESPMRVLEKIKAYGGDLDIEGVFKKVMEICDHENCRDHNNIVGVPILAFKKEKDSLKNLPRESLINKYLITKNFAKVDKTSMITYKCNRYSVPPEFIGKELSYTVLNNQLHIYYTSILVRIHEISKNKKLNYHEDDYVEIVKHTFKKKSDNEIEQIATENLRKIGERYD